MNVAALSKQANSGVVPVHGVLGLLLVLVAWPASWLHISPVGQYSFFPLWLGFILVMDALILRRRGTSLLTWSPMAFVGMFLLSAPLWWAFEGINAFTQNWRYLGAERYSTLEYALIASWHFSVVIPAVFEAAELIGTFEFTTRFRRGPAVRLPNSLLIASVVLGLVSLAALAVWPEYVFPFTWLSLLLILDPINYVQGRPSIVGWMRRGDWRVVFV